MWQMSFDRGEYEKSIPYMKRAIELDENYSFAYFNRSMLFSIKGDYRNAYYDAIKARTLGRNIQDSYLNELREKY